MYGVPDKIFVFSVKSQNHDDLGSEGLGFESLRVYKKSVFADLFYFKRKVGFFQLEYLRLNSKRSDYEILFNK